MVNMSVGGGRISGNCIPRSSIANKADCVNIKRATTW